MRYNIYVQVMLIIRSGIYKQNHLIAAGHSRTLLQCLRSISLNRLMRFRPSSDSPFTPVWGPSYDGVVVHSFRHRMRDYLERMARYVLSDINKNFDTFNEDVKSSNEIMFIFIPPKQI